MTVQFEITSFPTFNTPNNVLDVQCIFLSSTEFEIMCLIMNVIKSQEKNVIYPTRKRKGQFSTSL
jgi:hypothetical protein